LECREHENRSFSVEFLLIYHGQIAQAASEIARVIGLPEVSAAIVSSAGQHLFDGPTDGAQKLVQTRRLLDVSHRAQNIGAGLIAAGLR
jgi:hypothetical protein